MWECDYAREPVDYRLFWLKMLKKIWILPVSALAGFVLIGAVYYMSKLCFGNGRTYQAETMYYIDFTLDSAGDYTYLNQYTWGEVVKTDFFVDYLEEGFGGAVSREAIMEASYAGVESDVRYLYTRYKSRDREQALKGDKLLEEAVVAYGEAQKEFNSITVIKAATEAKDVSNIRLLTAAVLGACVGLFAAVVVLLVRETVDTSIYVPATLEKRYHVPALGAASMNEYEANCKAILVGFGKVCVVPGDESIDASEVKVYTNPAAIPCANPIVDPREIEMLKDAECVVVAVKAGAHNGKRLERTLEELGRINAHVAAFVLVDEDEKLIKKYYSK